MPAARWLDKIASVPPELTLQAPEVNGELLERVQLALLEDRQLACGYFAAHSNKQRSLTLNPLALIQRGNITYLAATVEPYEDVRLFAAHRFRQIELLDAPCRRPDAFRLDTYIASGALQFTSPGAGMLELRAWVSEELARQLRETPLSSTMRLQADGDGYQLRATLQDSWQLRWWLLSHTGKIVVHEPLALREAILRQLENGLGQYREATQADGNAMPPATARMAGSE